MGNFTSTELPHFAVYILKRHLNACTGAFNYMTFCNKNDLLRK
uniref:Uncharacterized protein n=1 Tax=Anguilla anguilla TaxID=7936 RepID=A0A0E9X0Z1_ANGAN